MSDTEFSIDIDVGSQNVAPAVAQLAALAMQLTEAGAASQAAAASVQAGTAAYSQAEASADKAAKALERITVAADAQRGKLQAAFDVGDMSGADRAAAKLENLLSRQSEAAAKASSTAAAMNAEAAALDKLKTAAAAAADNEAQLSKAHEQAQKAAGDTAKSENSAGEASGNLRQIAAGLGRLGGPLGSVGQQAFQAAEAFKKLGSSLGAAGPYVAIAVAIVAITAALVAATAAALKFVIANSDAARTQGLVAAGAVGSTQGGEALNDQINELSKRLPQSRAELTSMAQDLAKTGLRGDELAKALEDSATKAAKLKLGPDLSKGMITLDKSADLLHDNFSDLFKVPNKTLEPLLEGIAKLVALFDKTSVTGDAIHTVFLSIFTPLIDGLTSVIPKIISMFIQFEIYALQAAIKVKSNWSTIESVAKLVGYALAAVGVVLAVVVAWIILTAAAAATLVGGLVYLIAKFLEFTHAGDQIVFFAGLVASQFTFLYGVVKGAIDFISGLSLGEIGRSLVQGLADGITSGAAAVVAAITGVAGGAVDAAKSLLKINSPSKVFAEIGSSTGEGMVDGIDGSTGDVQNSLSKMVSPSDVQGAGASPAAAPGAKSSGGGGGGSDLSGATFNFYGVEGAEDALGRFKDLLRQVLEGDASQLGTAVPNV